MGIQAAESSLRVGMTIQEAYASSKKLLKQFVKADSKGNSDGILSANEFAAFYQRCDSNEVEMFPGLKKEDCSSEKLKKFEKFDIDNNGELSEEEMSSPWKAFWNGGAKAKKFLLALGAISVTFLSIAIFAGKNSSNVHTYYDDTYFRFSDWLDGSAY